MTSQPVSHSTSEADIERLCELLSETNIVQQYLFVARMAFTMNKTNRKILVILVASLSAVLIFAATRDFVAAALGLLAGLVIGLILAWSIS